MSLKDLARKVLERSRAEEAPTSSGSSFLPETSPELPDSDAQIERIGLRFDGPEAAGEPTLRHPVDGQPLAFKEDAPHVRVFAWCLLNLRIGFPMEIDIPTVASACGLSHAETSEAINLLILENDLSRSVTGGKRRRAQYLLKIVYPGG